MRSHEGRAYRGFTLLELLVVVALLGIVVTFVVLDVRAGRGQVLENAARQLAAIATLVEQESILRRRPLGLTFYRTGYRVVRFDTAWSAPSPDLLYRQRYLPAGIIVVGAPERSLDLQTGFSEPDFVMFPDGHSALSELTLADTSNGRFLRLAVQHGRLLVGRIAR